MHRGSSTSTLVGSSNGSPDAASDAGQAVAGNRQKVSALTPAASLCAFAASEQPVEVLNTSHLSAGKEKTNMRRKVAGIWTAFKAKARLIGKKGPTTGDTSEDSQEAAGENASALQRMFGAKTRGQTGQGKELVRPLDRLSGQPVELTLQLLEFLGPVELSRLGACSRSFKALIEGEDRLWRNHCRHRWLYKKHLDPTPNLPPFLDYSTTQVAPKLTDKEIISILLQRHVPFPIIAGCSDIPILAARPDQLPFPASPDFRARLLALLQSTSPFLPTAQSKSLFQRTLTLSPNPKTPNLQSCSKHHAAYILVELDSKRTRLSSSELKTFEWAYLMRGWSDDGFGARRRPFGGLVATDELPVDWSDTHATIPTEDINDYLTAILESEDTDPAVLFRPDGTRIRSPRSAARFGWPRERRWKISEKGLSVGNFPTHVGRRTADWGWEFSNGWVTYCSLANNPVIEKKRGEVRRARGGVVEGA